jgi:hypothetical protein
MDRYLVLVFKFDKQYPDMWPVITAHGAANTGTRKSNDDDTHSVYVFDGQSGVAMELTEFIATAQPFGN